MFPTVVDETLRDAWLTGPEGTGCCGPVANCAEVGRDETVSALLQPETSTDVENAAIPCSNLRRDSTAEWTLGDI